MHSSVTIFLVLVLAPAVCISSSPSRQYEGPDSVSASNPPSIQLLDIPGLKNLIAQRNGKPLFLNLWATWCAPCIEELPDIGRLAEAYNGKNLDVVGVSVDDREDLETKVVPFLAKHPVPFKVYIASYDDQESFINALNPDWSGAVPATLIYNAAGKLKYFKVGKGDYTLFKTEIDKIVKSPSN